MCKAVVGSAMKSILILSVFMMTGCSSSGRRQQERQTFYQEQLIQLNDSLNHLRMEEEKSASYLATAELHQVTRSPEEKERQLKNLRDYQAELRVRILSIESAINNYTDSLNHTHHP
jgi:uncharacterized protein YcfL